MTRCLLVGALTGLLAGPARATVQTPVTLADLARDSAAVVIGTVTDTTSVEQPGGRLVTLVGLDVHETLRGDVGSRVVLREQGGQIGDRRQQLIGAPSFDLGERVLVFLTVDADGSLRTSHGARGKVPLGATALGGVRGALRASPWHGTLVPRAMPPEAGDRTLRRQAAAGFRLATYRAFEPDEGRPLTLALDESRVAPLGLGTAREVWEAGAAAWNVVPGLPLRLRVESAPVVSALTDFVLFTAIDVDRLDCASSTVGETRVSMSASDTKRIGGVMFYRIVDAQVALVVGLGQRCPVFTPCTAAEVATHELGHVLGLGHSDDPTATMSAVAQFDCRCAALMADDVAGLRALYAGPPPPTIMTEHTLPSANVGTPYRVALERRGGTPPFTWAVTKGSAGEIVLDADGVLAGTPTRTASLNFSVTLADAAGDEHTRDYYLPVWPAGFPTTTTTSTTTTSLPPVSGPPTFACEREGPETDYCADEVGLWHVACGVDDLDSRVVRDLPGTRRLRHAFTLVNNLIVTGHSHLIFDDIRGRRPAYRALADAARRLLRIARSIGRRSFERRVGAEAAVEIREAVADFSRELAVEREKAFPDGRPR